MELHATVENTMELDIFIKISIEQVLSINRIEIVQTLKLYGTVVINVV